MQSWADGGRSAGPSLQGSEAGTPRDAAAAEVLLGRLARLVEEEEEEEGHGDGDLQLLNLSNTLNAVVQLGLDEEKMAQKLFRLVAAKVD